MWQQNWEQKLKHRAETQELAWAFSTHLNSCPPNKTESRGPDSISCTPVSLVCNEIQVAGAEAEESCKGDPTGV